ncbi:MAG: MGMT family protein [Acidobacteria bacterium]|nr:MGMT family protein [Acidobacteriota bacterium]MBI3473408.1 MGMT family protein [Candidatus Solibacter usitatus]
MKTRKSWRQKMNNPNLPKLVAVPPKMQRRFGGGVMLVPSPREVDALIRTVRKRSVITVSQIRQTLARKYAADVTCPLVTGIFVRIAAEAAEEDASAGKTRITPYWRVLKDDGSLNPKFPGGVERQEQRLRDEGQRIVPGSGKKPPRVVLGDSAERSHA